MAAPLPGQEANWRKSGLSSPFLSPYISGNKRKAAMRELMRTNDIVLISFVESLLRDAGIGFFVADQNMSILEGSLGILPRRVLIDEDDFAQARRVLTDAGIVDELKP